MKNNYIFYLLFFPLFISAQLIFPVEDQSGNTGLKNSQGKWILPPEYSSIGDFYDFRANLMDTVAVISKNEYYKSSNIVVKTKLGLINRSGKFLIPLQYGYLNCRGGNCIAHTFEDEVFVIDYRNTILDKIQGESFQIFGNLVAFYNGAGHYFKTVGSSKQFGPFNIIRFNSPSSIYTEKANGEQAFYNPDGSIDLENHNVQSRSSLTIDYEIIREISSSYDTSPQTNTTLVLIKNLKPKNKLENYSVYNLHTKKRLLNSEFPVSEFAYTSGVSVDPETGKRYFINNGKQIDINFIFDEYEYVDLKFPYQSGPLVFSAQESPNTRAAYVLNKKGKESKTDYVNMTNFYKGYALAMKKDSTVYQVNEKLKVLKKINHPIKEFYELDNNGIMISHYSMTDYQGNILLNFKWEDDLKRKSDFFYEFSVMYLDNGNRRYYKKYYDRTGKLFSTLDNQEFQDTYFYASQGFDYFTIHSDYHYYHYDYEGNFLGSSKDGLRLEAPKMWR